MENNYFDNTDELIELIKDDKNFEVISEKYENYKKGLRCGLLIGTITAGAAISAGLYFYYHHKEI